MTHTRLDGAARRGFTLVELLIGMVLTTILVTILYQVVVGQSRFSSFQTAQQEAQQNARGALELIASELRVVPSAGIRRAAQNSVQAYVPRGFGVACSGGTGTMDVAFPTVPATTIPTGSYAGPAGMMTPAAVGWAVGAAPTQVSDLDAAEVIASSPTCTAANVAGPVTLYRFTGSNFPAVVAGSLVAPWELVEYSVGSSALSSTEPYWINRGNTAGVSGTVAGPLPDATSLTFRYYTTTTGGTPIIVPVDNPVGVRRITVLLTTRSRSRSGGDIRPSVTDSVTVFLRNQ